MSAKLIAIVIGVGVAAALLASIVPLPGYYNVTVNVESYEVSAILVNVFGITSVQAHVAGQATLLDWGATGLGISGPALESQFVMTVCVGSHCTSKTRTEWFPTVPFVNGAQITASDSFTVGYVPAGSYSVTVTLTQSGSNVASGSTSVVVGG